MIDQEGFRAYLHVPDFLDPTRRSQTYISLLMSLLRERFFVHDGPRGLSGLLACTFFSGSDTSFSNVHFFTNVFTAGSIFGP